MGSLQKYLKDLGIMVDASINQLDTIDFEHTGKDAALKLLEQVQFALGETVKVMHSTGKRWNRIANEELEDVRYEASKTARNILAEMEAARLSAELNAEIEGDEYDDEENVGDDGVDAEFGDEEAEIVEMEADEAAEDDEDAHVMTYEEAIALANEEN